MWETKNYNEEVRRGEGSLDVFNFVVPSLLRWPGFGAAGVPRRGAALIVLCLVVHHVSFRNTEATIGRSK